MMVTRILESISLAIVAAGFVLAVTEFGFAGLI